MSVTKRVLILAEFGVINGGGNSLLAVIGGLQDHGWSFVAGVEPDSSFAAALRSVGVGNNGFSFFRPVNETGASVRKDQREIRDDLKQLFLSVSPDLIHCNSLSTSRICGPVSHECGVPALGYVRDILRLSRRAIDDINYLDRIVAVSHATRDYHIARGVGAERSVVIHNGIETGAGAIFQPEGKLARLPDGIERNSSARVLLSVGQISMRKGLDTLLESFALVAASNRNAHLLIVGQRHATKNETVEFERELRSVSESIDRSAGEKRVHWLGRRTDVPDLMRRSDLLVHAARQEPLGRVLIEACATGLPVVATNVGGTTEIFSAGDEFNPLVEPDDPSSMAERVLELLANDSLSRRAGQHNLQTVRENFSISRCVTELHRHYGQIANR